MQHAARLALVLVSPCVHVLRVALRDHDNAFVKFVLCGRRAHNYYSCIQGQTAIPHRNGRSLCCPCHKYGTSCSPASTMPMSNKEPNYSEQGLWAVRAVPAAAAAQQEHQSHEPETPRRSCPLCPHSQLPTDERAPLGAMSYIRIKVD